MKTLSQTFRISCLLAFAPILAQTPDPEAAHPPPSPGTVQVWLTTPDASRKLARQPDLTWSTLAAAGSNLTIHETLKYQEIDGFGATILDSSLWDADTAVREELMRLLFSRSSGIGLGMIRVPMGLSGLTGPHRTYNDLPSGQTDPTLSQFSIAGDQLWKLPMMQQAKALNPELTLLGTPWSAPAWMKSSGSLGYGNLKPEHYATYAQYFVKWLDAWRANGMGISAVTMQNEPHHEPYSYQGMRMEPADQAALGLLMGPAFKQAGHSTRILCWDHNCDEMGYPITVMDDPAARNWIHGAAFHAYGGVTSDIYQFTDAHPDKDVYFTEQTGTYPSRGYGGSLAWHLRHIFLVPSLNGSRSNLIWQLSRRMDDTLNGDRPFVRIAPDGKSYELHGEYYETGHFSKFIRKGARRIATNNPRDPVTRVFNGPLLYAAYQNPDGSKVLVALNDSSGTQSFTLEDLGVSGRRAPYSLPAGAVATFLWRDASGGSGLAATYFDNADFSGVSERRIDPAIDFNWTVETVVTPEFTRPAEAPMHSLGPTGFSARWEGQVLPSDTGSHTFHTTASDGVRLWVNGQLIIDQWFPQAVTEYSGSIPLTANQPATVRMDYFSSAASGGGRASLAWSTPTLAKQIIPRERLYPPLVAAAPPPPLGLSARAPGSGVQLAWAATPTAASYTVKRATASNGLFTVIASNLAGIQYTDTSTLAGESYIYQVTAVNAHGEGQPSASRSITPRGASLSPPWTQQDIGAVGIPGVGGNAGDNGETVVLGGAGIDIWNSADSFRYAWLPLEGDGTITARVASMEDTSPWAKAGVMIRESTAANSAYVNIVATPANGISVQSRASTGAGATSTTVSNLFAPRWLRLVRSGSTFTAYHSMNGVTWTQTAAPVTVAMASSATIGLAVCSGQNSALNLVQFDGISAPGLPVPRPPAPVKPEALPGNATINLAWAAVPYATSYEISRSTTPGGPYMPIATGIPTSYPDVTAQNDITYHYIIRALNSTGSSPASAEASATPRSSFLPAGWINRDIGTVGLVGSVSLTSGLYTIQAAGTGVWSTADGFNYSYRAATGDGSMTLRVDSLTNINSSATKSGLMFRSSAAPNAAYAYLAVTPGSGVKFEYRATDGASAASQGGTSGTTPRWLRLERSGNIVRAFTGTNGTTWSQVGADLTLGFTGDFLAGLAVTSNNTASRTTSEISQLSVNGFAGPLTPANLAAVAGLDGVRLTWDPVTGATGYRVKRMATGEPAYSVIATIPATSYWDSNVANRTSYTYVVTALNVEGEGSPSEPVSVTTQLTPLPSAWSAGDIGSTGVPGSADHSSGTFTVRGSGASLAGSADSLHACTINLSGALTFIARVADVGSASGTAKVGIMLRESTATGARFAYIGISPGGAMEFRHRSSSGGNVTLGASASNQSLPRYLRLVVTRSNRRSTFTASHSADGSSWSQLGSSVQINSMPSAILGSLVVCSMDQGLLHTAVFDQVSASGHSPASVPTGLVAAVTPTTIDLSWDAAANAASYRVKRSTSSGGPYLTLAEPASTTWQDDSAQDDILYHYVISSLNSFGESIHSKEISAIRATTPPSDPGRWQADAAGLWNDASKWSSFTPAGGTVVADFSTIDISADRTITLNVPVSLPAMVFGDTQTSSAGGWILDNQGSLSNQLTLTGSTPTITVNTLGSGKAAIIQAEITGSTGLRKSGPGTLSLAAFNPYSGGTLVEQGTLRLTSGSATGVIRGALTIQSGASLLSTAASSLGWGLGTRVETIDLQGGSLIHNPPGGSLTLSSVAITMTAGWLDSSGSAGFDFFDAASIGGAPFNTSVTTHASSAPATISGKINLRAGDNDSVGTVFTVADGLANEDLLLTADLANGSTQGLASRIQKSGAGRMVISGNNSYTGGTILNGGSLVAASPTALGASSTVTFNAGSGLVLELATADGSLTNPYTLDMGSNRYNSVLVNRATSGSADYSLGTLKLGASTMTFNRGSNISGSAVLRFSTLDLSAGNNDRPVILNGNATLRIGNAAILSNPNISKRLQLDGTATDNTLGPLANGPGTGVLSMIKAGSGTWTLSGQDTHTGSTTVQAGTLARESATLPDTAAVSIESAGTLHLAFTGTDIIGSLILDGTPQSTGTWGSLTSSAPNRSALIAGPGTLTILPAAYVDWANANGLPASATARALASDPDQDGIANCLEWVLGGHPMQSSTQALPKLFPTSSGWKFSFTRDPASMSGVPLAADWSSDLTIWHRIPIGATSSGPDPDGISVTITPVAGSPDQVGLTVPNGTTTGNLYLRLAAEIP
jgi:glucosylceramidase